MEGYASNGVWTKLEIGSSYATIYKHSTDQKITLTAKSIEKKANWTGEAASFQRGKGVGECIVLELGLSD